MPLKAQGEKLRSPYSARSDLTAEEAAAVDEYAGNVNTV
jgi:hypothetical protein